MSERKVRVRYSTNGGYDFSNWKERSLGELGEHQDRVRVILRRMGAARQFQFEVENSTPVKGAFLAAFGDMEQLGN